jgi:hypothetical protein
VILIGRLALYGRGAERLHEELISVIARWVEPSRRGGPLTPYGRDAEARTLDLLERSLADFGGGLPDPAIQSKLLAAAARDVEELLPRLESRAEEWAALAAAKLRARGEREASDLREALTSQRKRVSEQLAAHDRGDARQLSYLDDDRRHFGDEERRQLEADVRAWRLRLEQFDRDLAEEPDRIRDFYQVKATRVEPVGLVYLWPETN